MIDYLLARAQEKSTVAGIVTAVSSVFALNVTDEKTQGIFVLVAFVAGVAAAAMKERKDSK